MAELTEEEIAGDTTGGVRRRSHEYVNQWIINELLYQEALRRGIPETDGFQKQVNATRRSLAIAGLLERELYSISDTLLVSNDSVFAYFKSSGSAFVLHEDVVLTSYVLFSERDPANAFRSRVLRGTSWSEAVREAENDTVEQSPLLQVATRQYFTQSSLYPPELWKLARSLGREELSFVVKAEPGYYVLKVHSIKHQGDLPDLDYVRNEVRERLLIEQRRIRYERLIADLRARHSVDIRVMHIDTTAAVAD
jgi:hypothetical protein